MSVDKGQIPRFSFCEGNMNKRPQRYRRWVTLLALAFGNFVDQGESQALPTLFPAIRVALGLNYTALGVISGIRNILQPLTSPVWGILTDRFSRKWVLVLGTGIWGIWTALTGLASSYEQLLALRVIAGLGLGCLMPATFSVIGDLFGPHERGKALGVLGATGMLGIVVSVLVLGRLAEIPEWGWRAGFITMGIASVISGLVIAVFVKEPPRGAAEPELEDIIYQVEEAATRFTFRWKHVPDLVRLRTLWLFLLQGVFGTAPWVVLGTFMITWLVDDRGYSEAQAPLIFAAIVVGTGLSNIVGGLLGDWADRWNSNYGRTVVGQLSVLSGVPTSYFLLQWEWSLGQLVAFAFLTAFMVGWTGRGAKEPMMQAVVPPEQRGTAYALLYAFENGIASISVLIAGHLADRIGLTAMFFWMVTVAWLMCGIVWFGVYVVFPKEAARLRRLMADRRQTLVADIVSSAP